MTKWILMGVLAAVGGLVATQYPEIRRYLKMERM